MSFQRKLAERFVMRSYRYNILLCICFYSFQKNEASFLSTIKFGRFTDAEIQGQKNHNSQNCKNEKPLHVTNEGVFTEEVMLFKRYQNQKMVHYRLFRLYGETGISVFFKAKNWQGKFFFVETGPEIRSIIVTNSHKYDF